MMGAIQLAVLCVAVLVTTAGQTLAGIITNVSASTPNMGAGAGTSLANTVNGAGLSDFPSLEADHDRSDSANSWVSSPGSHLGYIEFDLGGLFLVDGFSFWNHNGQGLGIREVIVSASIDGTTFAQIAGSPSEFSEASGFFFVSPEEISFAPVTASHIRFEVKSNYDDDDQTGFSEVAFSSPSVTAVPEPSSVALFGIGACVAGVAAVRRRRREKQQEAAA